MMHKMRNAFKDYPSLNNARQFLIAASFCYLIFLSFFIQYLVSVFDYLK